MWYCQVAPIGPHCNRVLAFRLPTTSFHPTLSPVIVCSPASPITPWMQPIHLQVSCTYIDYHHSPVGNVLSSVLGEKQSLSKVRLQRWIVYRMRESFLSDIKLRTQAGRKLPVARQFYVQFSIGNTSRSTNSAKEKKNLTSWDNIFDLWVHVLFFTPEN